MSWLQNQLRAAEGILEAVDRTAKVVKETTSTKQLDAGGLEPPPPRTQRSTVPTAVSESSTPSRSKSPALGAPKQPPQSAVPVNPPPTSAAVPSKPSTAAPASAPHSRGGSGSSGGEAAASMDTAPIGDAAGLVPSAPTVPTANSAPREPDTAPNTILSVANNPPSMHAGTTSSTNPTPQPPLPVSSASSRRVVEMELDEARALAEATTQGASAREMRLQRVIERLKGRVEQYKQENEQLEEMLQTADAQKTGGEGALQALQAALATSEAQRITAEATLAHAIAAKDTTIARLTSQLEEAAQVQHVLEGEVEALQASKEALQAQHVDDETVMLHGLRGEMAVLEQRLRDEQAAHAASIHQAEQRQRDLETTLTTSAADLATMQRQLADRHATIDSLQAQLHALAQQQQQGMGGEHTVAGSTRGGDGDGTSPAVGATGVGNNADTSSMHDSDVTNANPTPSGGHGGGASSTTTTTVTMLRAQCDALSAQLADTRHALAEAQSRIATLQEQQHEGGERGRDGMRGMGGHGGARVEELEGRLHELSELLYAKQQQYERLSADKAAQQLAYQRQLQDAHEEVDKARRRAQLTSNGRSARFGGGAGGDVSFVVDTEVVPMDSLPAYYRLVENKRVGPAVRAGARYLDMGTSTLVRVLRQYPLARVAVFVYALLLHLYCYFLLSHMQRHAMNMEHGHMLMQDMQGVVKPEGTGAG